MFVGTNLFLFVEHSALVETRGTIKRRCKEREEEMK